MLVCLLACGSSTGSTGTQTGGEAAGPCPSELSECYDEGSRTQCLEVAETCPHDRIAQLESCPVQYACEEESEPSSDADAPVSSECAGYSLSDSCIDEENFAECQRLEAQCPGSVIAMESCPVQFACP